MKKLTAILLALVFVLSLCACSQGGQEAITSDPQTSAAQISAISQAKTLADLKGMKISAQAGTFHADALNQIEDVQSSTYPEFADLLTALTSKAIDGYIAEEPTALSETLTNESLTYIPLKNNDTGFKAEDSDVGIAVAVKEGSELRDKINEVIATITEEQKSELMQQMVKMAAGEEITSLAIESEEPANPTGTLKVAMECAYKPFNWTDTKGETFGAVPISSEGMEGMYANGYDVQIAKYIANKLGMSLEIYAHEWDSLIPAVNAGTVDAICAGMSPTQEREEQVDFSATYYQSNLVIIINK